MGHTKHEGSSVKTWAWLSVMVAIILFKGFFAYFIVSERGQPTWNYRPVPDVPGSSAYAIYPPPLHPQHIRGDKGE